MLRTRVRRATGTTGATLTVTHALGAVPDFYKAVPCSARNVGRTYIPVGTVLTNIISIHNDLQTTVTVDVFCWVWQGRLY